MRRASAAGAPLVALSARLGNAGRSDIGSKIDHMETFRKREKEVRRLERQKDKAARRIERKQNRPGSVGDVSSDDTPKAGPDGSPSVEPASDACR